MLSFQVPYLYVNQVNIIGNPVEFRLVFGARHPDDTLELKARIIVTPIVAKGIVQELAKSVASWEEEHGPIVMPESGLAEALFGGNEPPKDGDDDTEH